MLEVLYYSVLYLGYEFIKNNNASIEKIITPLEKLLPFFRIPFDESILHC